MVVWKVEMILNPFFYARNMKVHLDLGSHNSTKGLLLKYETTSIIVGLIRIVMNT